MVYYNTYTHEKNPLFLKPDEIMRYDVMELRLLDFNRLDEFKTIWQFLNLSVIASLLFVAIVMNSHPKSLPPSKKKLQNYMILCV